MKNPTINLKFLISLLSITCLLIAGGCSLNAQNKPVDLQDFKITIENNNDEIILKCTEGCAWTNLKYKNEKSSQAIDKNGMTESKEAQSTLANTFLLTITKTTANIALKGIRGTAWTDLSFSLKKGQRQMINQFGMLNTK